MFNNFLTALLHKIFEFLVAHKTFFELSEKDREHLLENLNAPAPFKQYLQDVNGNAFMKDMKVVLNFIIDSKKTNIKGNKFLEALAVFFIKDVAKKLDYLDGDFALLNGENRKEVVNKLIPTKSLLAEALRNILFNYSYQQLGQGIYNLAGKVMTTHLILVQSPRPIEIKLKKEIREKLAEQYFPSLPMFQVNKKIIGGLRIFKDGETIDHSWLSRVLHFTSLTNV